LILSMISVALITPLVYSAPDLSWKESASFAPVLRKNVLNLTPTEVQGLRDAVAAMKALPAGDPRSWQAQALIHNNFCPHGSLQFLPWHRKYLWYFEKILVSLSGGKLKALPYWEYTTPAQAMLPPIFVSPTYGAGIPNPLYHTPRSATYAPGVNPLPANLVDAVNAMNALSYNNFNSALEQNPHNNVHIQMGGTMVTLMSPLDPIFWVHHCNIDRLWLKWLSQGGGRSNPVDAAWLGANWNNTTFFDEFQNPHQLRNDEVLDIEGQLNYTYRIRFIFPFRNWYLWRRLFRWEILKPIPFDFVVGPKVFERFETPAAQVRQLARLKGLDAKKLNAVLEFDVEEGLASSGTLDLIATGGKGTRAVKVNTFSLFGLRHNAMEGMHGMKPGEQPKVRLVLSPAETALLVPLLNSRQISFQVRLAKGSANNSKLNENPRVKMNLKAIEFFQSVIQKRPQG
jgi:hypothetical protein